MRPIHADLEAERWTLGSILWDREAADRLVPLLEVEDFRSEEHQTIFRSIHDLRDLGRSVDAMAVGAELRRRGEYDRIGGDEGLADILGSVSHARMMLYHACFVEQKVIAHGLEGLDAAAVEDVLAVLEAAHRLMMRAIRGAGRPTG